MEGTEREEKNKRERGGKRGEREKREEDGSLNLPFAKSCVYTQGSIA